MGTTGQSITLANSMIGVGILAMPFCFQQCGVILAALILLTMGLVSRLCCYFLLKSAILARKRNFEVLAFHVFGSAGKLAVEIGIIGFLMGTCIAYFVVVGDLGPQIIAKMFNINQSDILRTCIMLIVSIVCILPLGLLRNVDSLSNVSAATIGFYFCLVMKLISEGASQMYAGVWQTRLELWRPSGLLQCVPIFSMALFCQTQLFEIFESMPTLSLDKMNLVTKNAINICSGVYFTLGVFGYIAFYKQDISGNILMSLSPTMGSDVIKLGFVMSVACSFPLIIFPCRASLYSLLYNKMHSSQYDHIINHSIPESIFRCITVAIIGISLIISLLIPDIELVLGLLGSTIGVMICVVFPAACFMNVTFKNTNERILAKAVLILGLIIMVLGTYGNLRAVENKHDKVYDDRYITQERIDQIVEDFFESKKLENTHNELIKPLAINDPIVQENLAKISDNIKKDSDVQPPNPVPPEPIENEKPKEPDAMKKKENLLKMADALRAALGEDINKLDIANDKNTVEKPEQDVQKEKNDKNIPKETKESEDDKNELVKKQELIDIFKKHDEEQRQLLAEQKEILNDFKNKQNANVEVKKIESIQNIAKEAIQRLSAVTDKPVDTNVNNNAKLEPLAQIANNAFQEIAKKAMETLEAIKEDKTLVDKPDGDLNNVKPIDNSNKDSKIIENQDSKMPIEDKNTISKLASNVVENSNVNLKPSNNVVPPDVNSAVNVGQNNEQQNKDVKQELVKDSNNINADEQSNDILKNKKKSNEDLKDNKVAEDLNKNVHLHSPDEPQSYKRGEDKQSKTFLTNAINDGIARNIPLAVALNENIERHVSNEAKIKGVSYNSTEEKIKHDQRIVDIIKQLHANNNLPPRNKREVLENADDVISKIPNKKNCINKDDYSEDVLPLKVNIDDLALPKSLRIDGNIIHHIRSLKSYQDTEKKR